MKLEDLKRRIDELIKFSDAVLSTTYKDGYSTYVSSEKFIEFRTMVLSFLKSAFTVEHPFYTEFIANVKDTYPNDTELGRGILKAAKQEIEGGWLFTTKGLVSAEIFSNFLEMAEHLLNEGYKDAAAVMIGSTLEEHLRQLCIKVSIPIETIKDGKSTPKKADTLNSELASASVYDKFDQKSVTTFLDLRNKAAHGKYSGYIKKDVELMLMGTINFMAKNTL